MTYQLNRHNKNRNKQFDYDKEFNYHNGCYKRVNNYSYYYRSYNEKAIVTGPICSLYGYEPNDKIFAKRDYGVPGRFKLKNNSPISKLVDGNDSGRLVFEKDNVRYSTDTNTSKLSLTKDDFIRMQNNVKITLAIKLHGKDGYAYLDSVELFRLIKENKLDSYSPRLDTIDLTKVLYALNEMLYKKSVLFDEEDTDVAEIIKDIKFTKTELEDYYPRICMISSAPVSHTCVINNNKRDGLMLNKQSRDQILIFYPAYQDYSKDGLVRKYLNGNTISKLSIENYKTEIKDITKLQLESLEKSSGNIKDFIINCPNDFLGGLGGERGSYKKAFVEAVIETAENNEEMNFHILNYEFFIGILKKENKLKKRYDKLANIHIGCMKNKSLDSTQIQDIISKPTALCTNPHGINGSGNGGASKSGGRAIDEYIARKIPISCIVNNPNTNWNLNSAGMEAVQLAQKLNDDYNLGLKYEPKEIRIEESLGKLVDYKPYKKPPKQKQEQKQKQKQDKRPIPQPQPQPETEILASEQIKNFILFYKGSDLKKDIQIEREKKLSLLQDRLNILDKKLDKIKEHVVNIETQIADDGLMGKRVQQCHAIPIMKTLLNHKKISDGKVAKVIRYASMNDENLINDQKLRMLVYSKNDPVKYKFNDNELITTNFEGFGIVFTVEKNKMKISFKENQFFLNSASDELKQLIKDGLSLEFPNNFDITDPKQANILMMVKTNPYFVINYFKDCKFINDKSEEVERNSINLMLMEFNRLTELKKQINKLDKIRRDVASTGINMRGNKFKIAVCEMLTVFSANKRVKDECLFKYTSINDINTFFIDLIKNNKLPDNPDGIFDYEIPININKNRDKFIELIKIIKLDNANKDLGDHLKRYYSKKQINNGEIKTIFNGK